MGYSVITLAEISTKKATWTLDSGFFCVAFFPPCYTNTNPWKFSWQIRFFNTASIKFSTPHKLLSVCRLSQWHLCAKHALSQQKRRAEASL